MGDSVDAHLDGDRNNKHVPVLRDSILHAPLPPLPILHSISTQQEAFIIAQPKETTVFANQFAEYPPASLFSKWNKLSKKTTNENNKINKSHNPP